MTGLGDSGRQSMRFAILAVLLAMTVSTGCSCRRSDVIHSITMPPTASDSVRSELRALEGTDECVETRDFLLDDIAPYLSSIRAAME